MLEHLRVTRTRDGVVTLEATDLTTTARYQFEQPNEGAPCEFLLPFQPLNQLVKGGKEPVLIGVEPKLKLRLNTDCNAGSIFLNSDKRIAIIIKAACDHVRKLGAKPIIVPAMGSHGGGTPEGQREIIEGYGVTEAFTGSGLSMTARRGVKDSLGARAGRAAGMLRKLGYEKAQVLVGGLKAWREASLPIDKTA